MTAALVVLVLVAGVLVGVLSGLLGVGGGLVMVPFIVLVLGEGQHLAEGTSLVVIVPTAIAGVIAHRRRGFVSFRHAALIAAGGIAGAYVGAGLALRLRAETLQVVFAAFLALMAIQFIVQGARAIKAPRRDGTR